MFVTYIHFLNAVIAILFSQWSLMVSLDASSISIGWIVSPMMWFGHVRDNRSCQTLSVNGACPLVICAVPTPVKTTPELSGPAFGVLPKTGDEELEDRGKPSWEQLRMICARSTLAWRRQDGMLWIDLAWRLLVDAATSSWHAPEREEPRESAIELHQWACVNNVIHCLLMTADTEVWYVKATFVQTSTCFGLCEKGSAVSMFG